MRIGKELRMRNCGNCDCCAGIGEDLVCANPESEYASDYVEESHTCDDWSGNEEEEDD